MGLVFDHANEAVPPLIVDRVGRLDPGAWGISQRIGQQFILAVPELRSHAWAKAGLRGPGDLPRAAPTPYGCTRG